MIQHIIDKLEISTWEKKSVEQMKNLIPRWTGIEILILVYLIFIFQ